MPNLDHLSMATPYGCRAEVVEVIRPFEHCPVAQALLPVRSLKSQMNRGVPAGQKPHRQERLCYLRSNSRLSGDTIRSQIGMEHFGDENRTIRLLIIFHDGEPGASHGEA